MKIKIYLALVMILAFSATSFAATRGVSSDAGSEINLVSELREIKLSENLSADKIIESQMLSLDPTKFRQSLTIKNAEKTKKEKNG